MIFLKLGGSLITDKSKPETARLDVLSRLAIEIREALDAALGLRVVLGHGSGSFGHRAAARHGTHRGAADPQAWRGFADVWAAAARLNRLVVDAMREAGLPALAFPPSASAICDAGELRELAVEPLAIALEAGLLPVVAGDVALDRAWGSAIVSTERVFTFLAPRLRPSRVLLAGIERGVYSDFPENTAVLPTLSQADAGRIFLAGSTSTDVTGGMAGKVTQALALAGAVPGLEVRIFSGETPGGVRDALLGGQPGTLIVP